MSLATVLVRPRRGVRLLPSDEAHERSVRRRVGLTWTLLWINVLAFSAGQSAVPIPSIVGKGITQGALPLALAVALSVNPRLNLRPNVFMCLLSLLVLETILTATSAQFLRSSIYRTFRFTEFVTVLWLLSPFFGRRDMLLMRCHLKVLLGVLVVVILGIFVSPGFALGSGRLAGAIWPMPPTQIGHYAAMTAGLTFVLWLSRQWPGPQWPPNRWLGRHPMLVVSVAIALLLLTRTRTALVALVAGILIAGLSLIVAHSRVRRAFGAAATVAALVTITLSRFITAYLARGENSSELANLTGRTKQWGPLLALPRDKFQEIFGFGLSNASFNGLPIDSNWLASYQEQGLFGVVACAVILVFLLATAYFRPRGVRRALALFIIVYCLLASFTEVGITDASSYMLDLTLAASLIVPLTGIDPAP